MLKEILEQEEDFPVYVTHITSSHILQNLVHTKQIRIVISEGILSFCSSFSCLEEGILNENLAREMEFDMEPLATIARLKEVLSKARPETEPDSHAKSPNHKSSSKTTIVEKNLSEKASKTKRASRRVASNIVPDKPERKVKKSKPRKAKKKSTSKRKVEVISDSESSELDVDEQLVFEIADESEELMDVISDRESASTDDVLISSPQLLPVFVPPTGKRIEILCNGVLLEDDDTLVGVIQNDALKHSSTPSLNLGSIWREKHRFTVRFVDDKV